MNILALNPGSGTLRYKLLAMPRDGGKPRDAAVLKEGNIDHVHGAAIARAAETPHIILNAPLVGQRLGYPDLSGLDLLELFAFIHPARFAVPTAAGLSRTLGLDPPDGEADAAAALKRIADRLLYVFTLQRPKCF